jgi:hypothetical protein
LTFIDRRLNMSTFLWLLVVAGGPLLIAIVIIYALLTRRRLSRREKAAQINATEHLYDRK